MALVGPLIICLYYSDAPVVGSMKNLLDDVPADLLLVLQHVAPLAPLLLLALSYCTGVLIAVGHTCFLCSGPDGVASLVPLMFWCIFPLFLLMVEFYVWTGKFLLYVLIFFICIHPWRWVCLIFHFCKFSTLIH